MGLAMRGNLELPDGRRIALDAPLIARQSGETVRGGGVSGASRVEALPEAGQAELTNEGLKQQVKAATSKIERELIRRALSQTDGNVTHAARLLKISRKGLQLKMKELDLRGDDAAS